MNFLKKETKDKKSFSPNIFKSNDSIVAEIHETFYTEVDRLLEEAKKLESTETNLQDELKKAERLKKLGFNRAKIVSKATKEERRIQEIEEENKEKVLLGEIIMYFSNKYPLYRFITQDSVIQICDKYGLIFGPVSKYTGDVPDKNLEIMEKFEIKKEDKLYTCFNEYYDQIEEISYENYRKEQNSEGDNYEDYIYDFEEAPLEIVAPSKDFDHQGMELHGLHLTPKIEVKDPIVIQPVFHKERKGYLIVTAWGEEAGDENVVNPLSN